MPGTLRGEMFEMPLEDALSILLVSYSAAGALALDECGVSFDEVAEMRRAAYAVVESHAVDVIRRYASKPEPHLKVVVT
jgi:hypothetical protein